MREFRQLAPNAIHQSPTNPQRLFSEDSLDARTASVHAEDIQPDELFLDVLGKPDRTAAKRCPPAIAVTLARRHGWQRDDLVMFSKRLGVKVSPRPRSRADTTPPDSEPPNAPTDGSRKALTRAWR
jgi:hypothetical protein